MRTDKVALLTCESDIGRIAARYLAARFAGLAVVVERNMARSLLLRRRVKRLGLGRVGGQLAFMAFQRVQHRASRGRIAEIVGQANVASPVVAVCQNGTASGGMVEANPHQLKPIGSRRWSISSKLRGAAMSSAGL